VIVVLRHSLRAFVDRLDFRTSVPGRGTTAVITDLGVLEADASGGELMLVTVHPGVTVDDVQAATGWDLRTAAVVGLTPAPTEQELDALRGMTADVQE
jgi:acyl CoA:acetate/3-ketoacid CoA transferase beta subunit